MQLVIDIPQTTYNHVFDNAGISNNDLKNILLGICKSVVLPSRHGRLIDADWVKNTLDIYVLNEYNGQFIRRSDIDSIPTIIEADKAGEEE